MLSKVIGIIAVIVMKPQVLLEWGYTGVFFGAVLATDPQCYVGDGIT